MTQNPIHEEILGQPSTQETTLNSSFISDKKQESELLNHLYVHILYSEWYYSFFQVDDIDSGAVLECLKPINDENTVDMFQFFWSLNPVTIFQNMEISMRVIDFSSNQCLNY